MQKAFGIFEGGGGKGLAHVGALSCAEDNDIQFVGVAGASAGAIVASLVACGYRANDLFDPKKDDSTKIYSATLKQLLGPSGERWREFECAYKDAEAIPVAQKRSWKTVRLGWRVWRFKRNHKAIVSSLEADQGIFDTVALERYLDERLEDKLLLLQPELAELEEFRRPRLEADPNRVLFKHVSMPLKIVATDIDKRQLIEFSKEKTPELSVAEAVAASISLPIVFKPKRVRIPADGASSNVVRELRAIDGGLLSNFPAWLFDAERATLGPHYPTFGFRLIETPSDEKPDWSPLALHLKSIVGIVINGDPLLETREIENLHEIPLKVTFSTLDFDLSYAEKCKLHGEGRSSAYEAFSRPGFPRDRDLVKQALEKVVVLFRLTFGVAPEVLLRANIVCLTTRKTLRVTYHYNMDTVDDTDDQLEFAIGSGACSKCWKTKDAVSCNLEKARSELDLWKMDKYQLALVRRDLQALICQPILDEQGEILGVLNIDSPDESILSSTDDNDRMVQFASIALPPFKELLSRKPSGGLE